MAKKAWLERNKQQAGDGEEIRRPPRRTEGRSATTPAWRSCRENASPTRVINRCTISGRRRGYLAQVRRAPA
jgi:hypothetical protein